MACPLRGLVLMALTTTANHRGVGLPEPEVMSAACTSFQAEAPPTRMAEWPTLNILPRGNLYSVSARVWRGDGVFGRCTNPCVCTTFPACFFPVCLATFVCLEGRTTSSGCRMIAGRRATCSQYIPLDASFKIHLRNRTKTIVQVNKYITKQLDKPNLTNNHYLAEWHNYTNPRRPHGLTSKTNHHPGAGVAEPASPCLAAAGPGCIAGFAACGEGSVGPPAALCLAAAGRGDAAGDATAFWPTAATAAAVAAGCVGVGEEVSGVSGGAWDPHAYESADLLSTGLGLGSRRDADVVAVLLPVCSAHTRNNIIRSDQFVKSQMPAQGQQMNTNNTNGGGAPAGHSQPNRTNQPAWKGHGRGNGSNNPTPATPAQWYEHTGQPHYGAGSRSASARADSVAPTPKRPSGAPPTRTNPPAGRPSWRAPGVIERQMLAVIDEKVQVALEDCRATLTPSDNYPGMHANIASKLEGVIRCSLPRGTAFTNMEQDYLYEFPKLGCVGLSWG